MADDSSLSGSDIRRRFQQSDGSGDGGQSSTATPSSGADIRSQFRAADEASPSSTTTQQPGGTTAVGIGGGPAESALDTFKRWLNLGPTSSSPLADVITSPEAQSADMPAGTSMPTKQDVINALTPAPGRHTMTYLPITGDEGTGANLTVSLPEIIRSPLLGLLQGGGANALQADPVTGAIRLTPEATAAGSLGANPLRFSGANPLVATGPAAIDLRGSSLNRPVTVGELTDAIRRADQQPPSAAPSSSTTGPTTPSPGPNVAPSSASSTTIMAIPKTSADALPVATRLLDKAKNSGADLQPDYVNRFIDKVTADAEPAGPGTAAVAGPSDPVAAMVERLQALRDQPLNIKDVMGMDQELNARQRAAIKTDPDLARRLGNLQDSLRDQVDAATEADVGGGADGWNAFKDGRAAYSQYKKMQAVENMKELADGRQNPTTSYKTAVNNFVNSSKARGWTDEEKASLVDSANRGVIGGTLHMLGSRLVPYVAGAAALGTTGVTEALASMLAAHYGGEMVRNVGNALQTRRFNRTMGVLGSGIPPNALNQPIP